MTTEAIAHHIDNILPEFVDSYLLVAHSAGPGEPFIRARCTSKEEADRINTILYAILTQGGVPYG